ncbi:Gag-Pol [Artemisia annua]|uniref:Gag-Pol n=1 Tax=Artemisia annua TaxID=35608 RepID=A0A2U1PNI8_ARTAN|nr:Gag-Pol [Artemisia annua]
MEKQFQLSDSSNALLQHDVNETTESQAPMIGTLNHEIKRSVWHSDYVMKGNITYCLRTEEGEPSILQEYSLELRILVFLRGDSMNVPISWRLEGVVQRARS